MDYLRSLWADANFQWVLAGTVLLGASSGILGSFALLRRRSLMGDVLAHAALPGVCAAFLLTGTKSIFPLLLGAAISGLLGSLCVHAVTRYSRIKEDTALGLVLSVFFGIGVVLLTFIGRTGAAAQAGLDKFLFGQAASLVQADVQVMAAVAALLCVAVLLLFKEFKLLCFDPGFGRGLGMRIGVLDNVLMLLVVCAVVIGLQAVGVVLMAAMLTTPAIAARYWTERLSTMVALAALFGAISGVLGTLASAVGPRLPTGPLIVLAATLVFLLSLGVAPRRGLLAKAVRYLRVRAKVMRENALRAVYEAHELAGQTDGARQADGAGGQTGVALADIARRRGISAAVLRRQLMPLVGAGLVELGNAPVGEEAGDAGAVRSREGTRAAADWCRLTPAGLHAAREVVRRHRLWEMFLMYEAHLRYDHVDRDADDVEHHLPREVIAELERLLAIHYEDRRLPVSAHPLAPGAQAAVK